MNGKEEKHAFYDFTAFEKIFHSKITIWREHG
jgi:hypothetical protein